MDDLLRQIDRKRRQQQQDEKAMNKLLREIAATVKQSPTTKKPQTSTGKKNKSENPLSNLRYDALHKVFQMKKRLDDSENPCMMKTLAPINEDIRKLGPYKLEKCHNYYYGKNGCIHGKDCNFYHGQDVDEMVNALLRKIRKNR